EDGIRGATVTGVQTCALPISGGDVDGAPAVALHEDQRDGVGQGALVADALVPEQQLVGVVSGDGGRPLCLGRVRLGAEVVAAVRSEERRVGRECSCVCAGAY